MIGLKTYQFLTHLLSPLIPALLRRRVKQGKEDPTRLRERLGYASQPRPHGSLIWVHGASVGEMLSLVALTAKLKDRGFAVPVTTGTRSSAELAASRLPEGVVHQYIPLDTPQAAQRFVAHWRPDIALFAESEIWPNLWQEVIRQGARLGVINGRMSEKSAVVWQKFPSLIGPLMRQLDLCLAQSEADAERYRRLGMRHAKVMGHLKYDNPILPDDPAKQEALAAQIGARPVLLAASTHPGEEEALLLAHYALKAQQRDVLTILAPRHPHRAEEIRTVYQRQGMTIAQRSRGERIEPETQVYLADTLGELGILYRLADVAFLGGSLIPHGGQNPIEPAQIGVPIVHGPHVFNFKEIYADFDAAGAACHAQDGAELLNHLAALLSTPEQRSMMQTQSRAVVETHTGALNRLLAQLEPFLEKV